MRTYQEIIKEEDFFLIAEVGVNYFDIAKMKQISLLDSAKLMIDEAKKNGAHAVKFQCYKTDKIASKNSPAYWDLNEEPTPTQHELFAKYDKFGYKEYLELSNYCENKDIIFLSTPFDYNSVDYLENLVPVYKISSSDITNIPFIEYIAKKSKPIFLSTGASTLGEIERAINLIKKNNDKEIVLMHCILDYPTKYRDINLNMIKYLGKVFPYCSIGFSDHTKPDSSMIIPTIAQAFGAKVLEKHFTLDKTIIGNDHYHSMDPHDLKKLIKNLRILKTIKGKYIKKPLKCENLSRRMARRSIVAINDIKTGQLITRNKITFKRPGTGIPPFLVDKIIGSMVLEDIKEDEIIKYNKLRLNN